MAPPRGGNAKAETGRAKKAANADEKAAEAAAAAEAREAASWDDPGSKKGKGKDSAEAKAEKKAEEARKKAEREAQLAEEEASIPDGGRKSAGKKAGQGKKGSAAKGPAGPGIDDAIASFSATNIDDALDAMSIATERTDNATQGSKAAGLERHPERRFKAAFEAFKEQEMARIKQEKPGMRSQQYHDALYKEFQKHPDNPFNQLTVAYDATKEEKLAALQAKRDATTQRLAG